MRTKVALFLEVRDNFSEGLRFYMSLQEAISHLAQQVGDYSMTRQIQRCHLPASSSAGVSPPPHLRNICKHVKTQQAHILRMTTQAVKSQHYYIKSFREVQLEGCSCLSCMPLLLPTTLAFCLSVGPLLSWLISWQIRYAVMLKHFACSQPLVVFLTCNQSR